MSVCSCDLYFLHPILSLAVVCFFFFAFFWNSRVKSVRECFIRIGRFLVVLVVLFVKMQIWYKVAHCSFIALGCYYFSVLTSWVYRNDSDHCHVVAQQPGIVSRRECGLNDSMRVCIQQKHFKCADNSDKTLQTFGPVFFLFIEQNSKIASKHVRKYRNWVSN